MNMNRFLKFCITTWKRLGNLDYFKYLQSFIYLQKLFPN